MKDQMNREKSKDRFNERSNPSETILLHEGEIASQRFLNPGRKRTPFVQLDTKKCKACWKCITNCSNQVIGKVDLPWHKHALIIEPDACTGCFNCVSTCQNNAFSIFDRTKQKAETKKQGAFSNFILNYTLLIATLAMIFSGMVLQIGFHMGGPDENQVGAQAIQSRSIQYEQMREINTAKIVCGFTYSVWSTAHKVAIVAFSLLMIYHTYVHWRWYKGVITKHLIGKNRQVIILSGLFLLVAFTGFIPWFIDLSGGTSITRMHFIEIHDKLALLLIVFLILHFVKRAKWFALKGQHGNKAALKIKFRHEEANS